MSTDEFNNQVIDAMSLPGDDEEIQGWIATTFGRLGAGAPIEEPKEGTCPICSRTGQIAKRRRNTSYANDENNWQVSCEGCFEEDYARFQDLWDEYYGSRL